MPAQAGIQFRAPRPDLRSRGGGLRRDPDPPPPGPHRSPARAPPAASRRRPRRCRPCSPQSAAPWRYSTHAGNASWKLSCVRLTRPVPSVRMRTMSRLAGLAGPPSREPGSWSWSRSSWDRHRRRLWRSAGDGTLKTRRIGRVAAYADADVAAPVPDEIRDRVWRDSAGAATAKGTAFRHRNRGLGPRGLPDGGSCWGPYLSRLAPGTPPSLPRR
jgi:hypothetical protein